MKKNWKKLLTLLSICIFCFSMAGCWDRVELEDQAFALLIGLDKAPKKGVIVSLAIAIPSQLAGGGPSSGGQPGSNASFVIGVVSPNFASAINMFSTYINRRINIMHAESLVIGEDLAKSGQLMRSLGPILQYPETRRTMKIIVTKGTALNFLETSKPTALESNMGKYMLTLTKRLSQTGLAPAVALHEFMLNEEFQATPALTMLAAVTPKKAKQKSFPKDQTIPDSISATPFLPGEIPRIGGDAIELVGAAIFKKGKMVGQLNGSETRVYSMMTGTFGRAFMSFQDPLQSQERIALDLRQGSEPVVKVSQQSGKTKIYVRVKLEGELMGLQSEADYTTEKNMRLLEQSVAKQIRERCLKLMKKTQHEIKGDIFNYSDHIRYQVLTWPEYTHLNWPQMYENADVEVAVKVELRRIGLLFKPLKKNM